jgi:hypothetical protein
MLYHIVSDSIMSCHISNQIDAGCAIRCHLVISDKWNKKASLNLFASLLERNI